MLIRIFNKIKKKIFAKKVLHVVDKPFFTKAIFADKKFNIGEYTYGKPTVLFENKQANLTIGKFCSIADNVTIFLGGNHRTDWISTYPFNVLKDYFPKASNIEGHPSTKGDVIIGNDVWIGNGVTIMSGISIGDGAVLAAGSVVVKNVGDYEIHGGNPAKLLKLRFKEEEIIKLKTIKWWNWDIEKIKANTSILCSSSIEDFY
ncbi:CatB-related O-acetyltransferase [uncultured Olleya sp.]|uniref:CatB-related O-acetyltransferase n=1 Tax=uncultured Olleya sp. TaxID=757243 RepID=UPI00259405D4|nr:CatB-related O-acetyltransferase [uncultured Olleya sp.]